MIFKEATDVKGQLPPKLKTCKFPSLPTSFLLETKYRHIDGCQRLVLKEIESPKDLILSGMLYLFSAIAYRCRVQ